MSLDSGLSLLLAEEFDSPAPPLPDLEALLATARTQARTEMCGACEARAAESRQALAAACVALAAGLADAFAALDTALAETAHALATAIVTTIVTALPGWQARLDRNATADIATTLLTTLGETASPRLAVCPDDAAELRSLLPPEIGLDTDATMARGALRLVWRNGRAILDPAAICTDIRAILSAALDPAPSLGTCGESIASPSE